MSKKQDEKPLCTLKDGEVICKQHDETHSVESAIVCSNLESAGVDDSSDDSNGEDLIVDTNPDGICSPGGTCFPDGASGDKASRRALTFIVNHLKKNITSSVDEFTSTEAQTLYQVLLGVDIARGLILNIKESSSILKTFSVDVNQKPELSVYLDTLFMQMQHSPRYFPDGNIKYNYSTVWRVYMDQDNSFNVENYIAPGAYLRISDTSEDNKLWKVFFTETSKETLYSDNDVDKKFSLYAKRSSGDNLYIVPISAVNKIPRSQKEKQIMVATTKNNIVSKNPFLWKIRNIPPRRIAFSGKPFK